MSQFTRISDSREAHHHCLQLDGADQRLLAENVAGYLSEGLERGAGLLVIATRAHIDAIVCEMECAGAGPETAAENQIVLLDAEQTLKQFMVRGQPDWTLFQQAIEAAIAGIRARPEDGLRAYGEMVGVLWEAGSYAAAIKLEQFWNRLLAMHSFELYCAYPIDIFGAEFQLAALDALLPAHTHFAPGAHAELLESALHRSMDDLLGRRADGLRSLMSSSRAPSCTGVPQAEADILWLRAHLPEEAESILQRARSYYQASHRHTERAAQAR